MFIDPNKVFAHLDRLAAWDAGKKPAPVTVEWDLSNRCVLGCQDCHFAHTHVKGPWASLKPLKAANYADTGDLADFALVHRAIDAMAVAGVKAVIWSGGGEPTTHPEWPDVLSAATASGLQQGMYTLGGLFTEATAAHAAQHLTWAVVSLDAMDAESYGREKRVPSVRFQAACNGIRWLVQARGAVVGVSYLLHAGNWIRAPRMLAHARELGAAYVTFRPAIQTSPVHPGQPLGDRGWISAAMPLLDALAAERDVEIDPSRFAAYRDWTGHGYSTCYGIRLNATITPDGRVWVCPQRRGIEGSCVGDLRVEAFSELWAKHPGRWTDFGQCRAMCRLHLVNQQLATVYQPYAHEAFV